MNDAKPPDLDPAREETLARYLAGDMTPEERANFERAALDDPGLFEAVYATSALGESVPPVTVTPDAVVFPRSSVGRRRRRGWWTMGLPAAAALLIAVALWSIRPSVRESGDVLRGSRGRVEVIEPRGDLKGPPRHFVWKPVAGATGYRVEVLDASAHEILLAMTPDPVLDLEEGSLPDTLRTGVWRVVALDAARAEIASSAPAVFHVTRP